MNKVSENGGPDLDLLEVLLMEEISFAKLEAEVHAALRAEHVKRLLACLHKHLDRHIA